MYAAGGSAPLNLSVHHAVDMNVPIGCGGVAVFPNDIIVADEDGAVVIPEELLDEVTAAAVEQERLESWIMKEVGRGEKLPGLYPPNDEAKARYEREKSEL